MLMKLLASVFERARSKVAVARSDSQIQSDSNIKTSNIDAKHNRQKVSSWTLSVQQQPRSSLSKWLCATSTNIDRSSFLSNPKKIRRASSWRSIKQRVNNFVDSRTLSVDQLHRTSTKFQRSYQSDAPSSSIIKFTHRQELKKCDQVASHTRLDQLLSTAVNYCDTKKKSRNQNQFEQRLLSSESHHNGECDSGYAEEIFAMTPVKCSLHLSYSRCHDEQRSLLDNYKQLRSNSSSESSSSNTVLSNRTKKSSYSDCYDEENSLSIQSYLHIKSQPKVNIQVQKKITRPLIDKRRRNLSYDSSLWMRTEAQKTSSPVDSESNHLSLQRHFTTIDMENFHSLENSDKLNSHVFGELNIAAIELDSLRPSFSSTSSSTSLSSTSINNEISHRKQTSLVWHEYKNPSSLSSTNGTKPFSVIRGDNVRLLKRVGKSTLLVQKLEDGSIGFLPQSCLAYHQINTFLFLKGLKETIL